MSQTSAAIKFGAIVTKVPGIDWTDGTDAAAAYFKCLNDNGGVHVNSGIPNRAFAEAARALGGNAWETVGPVWYAVLTDRLRATAQFADAAAATIAVAGERYGEGSREQSKSP